MTMAGGQFDEGIACMAEKCPYNGSVTATFRFHANNMCGFSVTTDGKVPAAEEGKAVDAFTPDIREMLVYKLDRMKQHYGSVTATVIVADGGYESAEFMALERVSKGQAEALARTERNRRKRAA